MTALRRGPSPCLRGRVWHLYGFEERAPAPVRRREGPGIAVVVVLALEERWLIDGEARGSFVGGLHERQVVTEHAGRALGMQVDLDPVAARALLGVPLHELSNRTVALEDVLDQPFLAERLAVLPGWEARLELLDAVLAARLAGVRPAGEVAWAWGRLRATHGAVATGALAAELGWSRKRLVARFRDEVGVAPKAAARLVRFERARRLAGSMTWAELAAECGFCDQSHLSNEFRAITGRPPGTFLQDPDAAPA